MAASREEAAYDAGGREVVVATLMRRHGGSGVQTHVRTLVEHQDGTASPVRVVNPFDAGSALVRPVFAVRRVITPVTSAGSVWWYREWHARFLRRALAQTLQGAGRPQVVYAQCPPSAEAALAVRGAQPVVMAAHFNVSEADEWAAKGDIAAQGRLFTAIRALEARVLPRLDGIVYVSESSRRDCLERIPAVAGVPSVVVPNCVPLGDVPDGRGPGVGRGVEADLVTVGSLEPRKNQAYLLDVLAAARRRGRRCTLTVVGDGPQRAALEQRARMLGLAPDVRFVGHRDDVARLLPQHRVYCHTSRMESFGIVLVEAMAAGVPVLAAPVGGVPEVVRDGLEGRYWPLDDPEAAADVLLAVLDDEVGRSRMGRSARSRAEQVFATDVQCPRLLDFLASVPRRRAGVAPR